MTKPDERRAAPRYELKQSFAGLKVEIRKSYASSTRWAIGGMVFLTCVFIITELVG